ncbi:ZIP family metal transporter [Streptomyces phaeolivaceus]|uniref:ZIP family metal transporter n=1 Tax=Streptomyces phaeolivaceus TaxID=2653200 RepID=UPI001D03D136|nr:ZIP family metal transporter [Streptomyces phaeolivaceus]
MTVVLPVRLKRIPDWTEGPFPFELGSRRTDAETRSTYFAPASARALYGGPGRPRRWHLPTDVKHDGLHLIGLELLRAASARDPEHALAVLHFSVERPLLPILRALAGRRSEVSAEPLTGCFDPTTLLVDVADVRTSGVPFAIARPYSVAFMTPTPQHTPALRTGPERELPADADRWLWQLASRSTPDDFPVPPETAHAQLKDAVRISADWSALVLRQGAAFLGHRPDTGQGDFFEFGALHSRTVYLDALLLGVLQRDHIDELTDELSGVFDSSRLARRVATLERNIAVFRSTYWRQHLTAHGPANDLLLAFHNQHRLPARFDEILAEAGDYSRLVQTQESQQISGALGLLTILGLPLGTALGILQVLDDHSVTHLLISLGLSVAATAAALTTRYGRLVLSSLRGGIGRV